MPHVLRYDAEKIPPVLRSILLERGWTEYNEDIPEAEQPRYTLWWKSARFTVSQLNGAQYPAQRLNHFPKSGEITKKDTLLRNLRRMKGVHGQICDVLPPSYILPGEYVKFCQAYADAREEQRDTAWICKPSELSRGRKIYVFRDIGQLTYDCPSVVQSYIHRPLLLSGYKFDLRVYVLVTSFQPLRAYVYDNFLVRFGTEKYDTSDLTNLCSHLTNTSLNRFASGFDKEKEGIGEGCKWDAPRFKEWVARQGYDFDVLWRRLQSVVTVTLLSICGSVPSHPSCFELYGFDLLLDSQWKPWLLEVNFSPALHVDGAIDERVKRPLVADMLDTLNIPSPVEPSPHAAAAAAASADGGVGTDPDSEQQQQQRRHSRIKPRLPSRVARAAKAARGGQLGESPRSGAGGAQQGGSGGGGGERPCGGFARVFPFSEGTEEASACLAACAQGDRDGTMRSILSEVKKRELAALQQHRAILKRMRDADKGQQQGAAAGASSSAPEVPPPPATTTSKQEPRPPQASAPHAAAAAACRGGGGGGGGGSGLSSLSTSPESRTTSCAASDDTTSSGRPAVAVQRAAAAAAVAGGAGGSRGGGGGGGGGGGSKRCGGGQHLATRHTASSAAQTRAPFMVNRQAAQRRQQQRSAGGSSERDASAADGPAPLPALRQGRQGRTGRVAASVPPPQQQQQGAVVL